jgi:UDP-glucose 4-epimerase
MSVPKPPLPKKILITGARARLAGCIRPHLQEAGREVVMLSRTESDGHLGLENLFLSPLVEQSDTLLHLAWSTLPATSERHIGIEWESDLPLLFRILRRIVESPQPQRLHFIFFSSGGAVYGTGTGKPARETDACRPIGWYARAKLAAESIIQAFGEQHGLTYTILRVTNPYGFSVPSHRAQGIIPHAFECARTGQPLSLWGDGSACKDFIHYTDFNRALQAVIDRRLTGIYNLAYGSSTTIGEIIALVEKASGRKIQIEAGPARPWDVQSSLIDNHKLREIASWAPAISIEQGIQTMSAALGR